MSAQKKILMIVTSHDLLDGQRTTGLWLEEAATPYRIFAEEGFSVDIASIKGGKAPVDVRSIPEKVTPDLQPVMDALERTMELGSISEAEYDAVYLPGGHGTMFDLPGNERLQEIIRSMYEKGKTVAAVCHGPSALVSLRLTNGTPLIKGKTVTAFTNGEELEAEMEGSIPFYLETRLLEDGAIFKKAPNWHDHIERDGNLITGQNPQSSASIARAVAASLAETQAKAAQAKTA